MCFFQRRVKKNPVLLHEALPVPEYSLHTVLCKKWHMWHGNQHTLRERPWLQQRAAHGTSVTAALKLRPWDFTQWVYYYFPWYKFIGIEFPFLPTPLPPFPFFPPATSLILSRQYSLSGTVTSLTFCYLIQTSTKHFLQRSVTTIYKNSHHRFLLSNTKSKSFENTMK